jgi:hypothetical protein
MFTRILAALGLGSTSEPPKRFALRSPQTTWPRPRREDDIDGFLQKIAAAGWGNGPSQSGRFLFESNGSIPQQEEGLKEALSALYEHARGWLPRMEIPYRVPEVRIREVFGAAGQFRSDDGWLSVSIPPAFLDEPRAAWLILAHEACHHFLHQAALADCYDTIRNERMTDAAMFVCGFGKLVEDGHTFVKKCGSGYTSTHLGYLDAEEYSFAYHWVIAARHGAGLAGMQGVANQHPLLIPDFRAQDSLEELRVRLANRMERAAQERWIEFYRKKYPFETEAQILERILEDRH